MAKTAHTGAWGVLLVQQTLLSMGIDSSPMTTDSGIDLLAYDSHSKKSFSVQVKTRAGESNERRPDWTVKQDKLNEADLFAFVLKKGDRGDAWYLGKEEVKHKLKLQNTECALTFYLEGAPRQARLTGAQMSPYKNRDGLQRFLLHLAGKTR